MVLNLIDPQPNNRVDRLINRLINPIIIDVIFIRVIINSNLLFLVFFFPTRYCPTRPISLHSSTLHGEVGGLPHQDPNITHSFADVLSTFTRTTLPAVDPQLSVNDVTAGSHKGFPSNGVFRSAYPRVIHSFHLVHYW